MIILLLLLTSLCVDIDDCRLDSCVNGGTCIDGVNSVRCACSSGYTGVRCETSKLHYETEKQVLVDHDHCMKQTREMYK